MTDYATHRFSVGQQVVCPDIHPNLGIDRPDRRPSWAGIRFRSGTRKPSLQSATLPIRRSDERGANSRPELRRDPKENTMAKDKGARAAETKKPKQESRR